MASKIGSVKWRGEGAFYRVFSFSIEGGTPIDGDYVIRVLKPNHGDPTAVERLVRSSELLKRLDGAGGIAPRCLACDSTGEFLGDPFTIETWLHGIPVSEMPKDPDRWLPLAARELVRIHAIPLTDGIRALWPPVEDFPIEMLRRAEGLVNRLDRVPAEVATALDAARRLLPKDVDPVLLHGDAQMQNLLLALQHRERGRAASHIGGTMHEVFAWIDWEFARTGDRAYDLAIFTRGQHGSLHGRKRGRALYLDAYRAASGVAVPDERVLFYEILLVLGNTCSALEEGLSGSGIADQEIRRLAGLTRMRP